jgi:amidase
VLREFKRDLNTYLAATPGGAASLQGIIDYNSANPVEGLKYQQGELIAAQNADLSAYEADRTAGKAASQALIDNILKNGTPADPSDDFDVIMVPSGNTLVGIADRAGYPVLTVPGGEGTGNAGRNPIGLTFVGGAFSEAKLLAAGYAFEQGQGLATPTYKRRAPSFTNPSMWRCTPLGTFFTAELCNPGDHLEALAALVEGVGPGKSLSSQVESIQEAKAKDNDSACGKIGALINHVNAQNGKQIPAAQAEPIITEVKRIAAVSGC